MAYYPLEQLSRLYDGYQRDFNVAGRAILLCQMEGRVFIIENRCPHMDVALTYAQQLPNLKLRCRAHGIEFDMQSGKACGPLSNTITPIKHYTPIYEGSQIGVEF